MGEALLFDRFWEDFLGGPLAAGVTVVPHAGLAGYSGVWFFVRGEACVVSAPPGWCDRLEVALAHATLDAVMSEEGLRSLFGDAFDCTVGPSWLGSLLPGGFRPVGSDAVRSATSAELEILRNACSPEDAAAAGLQDDGAYGWFAAGEILAAASMTRWGETEGRPVVGPGVLSRRDGCGKAVVSAVCDEALRDGELVLYQTLRENERAVGLARQLGFAFYASHVAVRLQRATP